MSNKTVYFIREPNGKWNYSRTYGRHKILSSHGQGFSRREDARKSHDNNCFGGYRELTVTRKEFNAIFAKRKRKKKNTQ